MKKIISIMIIAILLLTTYTYALEEQSFFEVEKTEITKADTIELTLDLEKIDYNNFVFLLASNMSLENIETEQEVEINSEENNEIEMKINKQETSLTKIVLYYSAPEDLDIGEKIVLTASIVNLENEEESENVEIEITIIEEEEEEIEEETAEEELKEETEAEQQQTIETEKKIENEQQSQVLQETNQNQSFQTLTVSTEAYNQQSSQEQQAETEIQTEEELTYNGSSNNYLSELYVSNYELNKDFTKENSTYFITLDEDVESLEIVANAEDTNATVCIYGNDNLQEGSNKILISVTSENGNVRYYRIYANK